MDEYIKGRGSQKLTANPFLKHQTAEFEIQGLDEPMEKDHKTVYYQEHPKKMLNYIASPDVGPGWSMNPYQGCEHGCIYCYARNTHEYYGFSAGIDFESRIIVKENAADILRKEFRKKKWKPDPIMLAGNTDCYQPAEKKFEITRKILEACLEFNQPVGIITKNALVMRDTDILQEMAARSLVHVNLSITTLDEKTRLVMEPRTATAKRRLETVKHRTQHGVPVRVMAAPMIPFINSAELPAIMKAAADHGALHVAYTVVRLNGRVGEIFTDWIHKAFPDRAERVLNHIKEAHGGKLNDSEYGRRMRGEGNFIESLARLYKAAFRKYFKDKEMPPYDTGRFKVPPQGQLGLFD